MSNKEENFANKSDLMLQFEDLSIQTKTVDHPPVFTVEEMVPYLKDLEGVVTKNLFLKDKKKKFYLLSAEHNRTVSLNAIAKQVGASGGLRLADESLLYQCLGVKQGCVTAFALINDKDHKVKFLCDSVLLEPKTTVYFHPLDNAATTGISSEDFKRFLTHIDHDPVAVDFS